MVLNNIQVENIVRTALAEDLGTGDITAAHIFTERDTITAVILAKGAGVLSGLTVAETVFRCLSPEAAFTSLVSDGARVAPVTELARVTGPARVILGGERVALNFMQRMSGIATRTASYVKEVEGFPARILDTRKTTPGLRCLEKYAVRVGGGTNHRFGLYDAVMIKDNHIRAAGSIDRAVSLVRRNLSPVVKIEVEAETLDQVSEALAEGVEIIMLDNMTSEEMRRAVDLIGGRALVEASGGITLERVREVAATGVDFISVGELTHTIKALDISMEIY
ncbi:MAG: carboxylating nicotinate-nucleotide diphosphorylase [Bacillota bacterium]